MVSPARLRGALSPDALVLIVLLLLLALLSLGIVAEQGGQDNDQTSRRSVSSPRPTGWKAWYLLLEEKGVAVRKIERGPAWWPGASAGRVVVTGEPYDPPAIGANYQWDRDEAAAARDWVNEGGTLIVLAHSPSALLDAFDLRLEKNVAKTTNARLPPRQPARFFHGVAGVHVPGRARFTRVPAAAVPLLGERKQTAALLLVRGKGRVIVVSDAALAENQHLLEADNARFLFQLVSAYAAQPAAGAAPVIGFDEYHQGFQRADGVWTLIGRPGQLAFWQFAALAALMAYSAGRRFGLPRPLPAASRVSSEYVSSLADLYRRAGARDAALEGVYQAFRRELCQTARLPANTPAAELARTIAKIDPDREARLRRLLDDCETKIAARSVRGDGDLLTTARAIEAMRKELELGRSDRSDGVL